MIVVRFKVTCQPEKMEQALAVFRDVVGPSRSVEGVVHFDIGQDVTDPAVIIATEVFADEAALARQESLAPVKRALDLLPGLLATAPEATVYEVASAKPWGS